MKNKVKIDIISDIVCPWCYIGSNRLYKALAEANIEAEIRWIPFQLHPGITENGNDVMSFLEKKYNQPGEILLENVRKVAEKDGLPLHPEKLANMPNTFNAHRVMHLAREKGLDSEISALFFKAYFVEGVNLNNLDAILDIAEKGGLNRAETELILKRNSLSEEIAKEEEHYKMEEGVWVVPAFIFNDDEMIEGAQSVEDFIKFFNDIKITTTAAGSCSNDGCAV